MSATALRLPDIDESREPSVNSASDGRCEPMTKHNPHNERIKRQYFTFLKEAKRLNEATVDAVAMALARFEADTQFRDFKGFHFKQAIAFKRRLAEQTGKRSGERLSKATSHAILGQLKRFFLWLAGQPGFRSRLRYSEAEYFNLSDKDSRVATARRERAYPTLEQAKHVIVSPTLKKRRNLNRRSRRGAPGFTGRPRLLLGEGRGPLRRNGSARYVFSGAVAGSGTPGAASRCCERVPTSVPDGETRRPDLRAAAPTPLHARARPAGDDADAFDPC